MKLSRLGILGLIYFDLAANPISFSYPPQDPAVWSAPLTWIGGVVPTNADDCSFGASFSGQSINVSLDSSSVCKSLSASLPTCVAANFGVNLGELVINPQGGNAISIVSTNPSPRGWTFRADLQFQSDGTIYIDTPIQDGAFSGEGALAFFDSSLYGPNRTVNFVINTNSLISCNAGAEIGTNFGSGTLSALNFSGGGVINNLDSVIGNGVASISINGPTVLLGTDAELAVFGGTLSLNCNLIGTSSSIGPAVFVMSGGTINFYDAIDSDPSYITIGKFDYPNFVFVNASASLTGGVIQCTGGATNLYIACDTLITIPVSADYVLLSSGYFTATQLQQPSNITVNGTLSGYVVNFPGTLTGLGTVSGGTVENHGNIYANQIYIGPASNHAGYLNINSSNIIQGNALISGGAGVLGSSSSLVDFSGSLTQGNSSSLAFNAGQLIVRAGQIISDQTSVIGPCSLNLAGGVITNNGTMSVGYFLQPFEISAGVINGVGTLMLAGTCTIPQGFSLTQNDLVVGKTLTSLIASANQSALVTFNTTFSGTTTITGSGTLNGSGLILGPVINYGTINASSIVFGTAYQQTGALTFNQNPLTNYGNVGSNASIVIVQNGIINQIGGVFAYGAQGLIVNAGQINSDAASIIGPCALNMNGGLIVNNGTMSLGNTIYLSSFSAGAISGNGTLMLSGSCFIPDEFELQQANLILGKQLTSVSTSANQNAFVTFNDEFSGTFTITGSATLNGVGFITGLITNDGTISATNLVIGTATRQVNALTLNPTLLVNSSTIGNGATSIVIVGGTINQNGGSLGTGAQSIAMTGGYFVGTSSSFAVGASLFTMSGGTVIGDSNSIIGPCPFNLSAGVIDNDGTITIGLYSDGSFIKSNSTITGGTVMTTGSVFIAGDTLIQDVFSCGTLTVGQGWAPAVGTLAAEATLTVNDELTAYIENLQDGTVTGRGGLITGDVLNSGGVVIADIMNFGVSTLTAKSLGFNYTTFTNQTSGYTGYGAKTINLLNGHFINDNSTFGGGYARQGVTLSGGNFDNQNSSVFCENVNALSIQGGSLINDVTSVVGPVCLNMTAGNFTNNGTTILGLGVDAGSQITGGNYSGTGRTLVTGTAVFAVPVSQTLVQVGPIGLSLGASTPASFLYVNSNLTSNVTINDGGALLGTGQVIGDVTISGLLSPGPAIDEHGSLTVTGNLTMASGSQITIWIGPNGYSSVHATGNLSVTDPCTIYIEKEKQFIPSAPVDILNGILSWLGTGPTSITDFTFVSPYQNQPSLVGQDINVVVDFSSLVPCSFSGNAGVVANDLIALNFKSSLDMQDVIDDVFRLPCDQQKVVLLEMWPQFKLIQYSLEKLLFTEVDLFRRKLSDFQEGITPFVDLNFDQYAQNSSNPATTGFNKYNVNSWVQDVGFRFCKDQNSILLAAGLIESYFGFTSFPASARYKTGFGNLGYAKRFHDFEAMIDVIGSYSAINTQRKIEYFNATAKSHHCAWNVLSAIDLGYKYKKKKYSIKPYDQFGFIVGKETGYSEKGAGVLDIQLEPERLSELRNTLGFISEYQASHFSAFLDLAWVYEAIFSSTRYMGQFVNTQPMMDFYATPQNRNFGKGALGFKYSQNGYECLLNYQALVSKRFLEQTAQFSFGKTF